MKIGEGQTGFAPQDYALPIGGAARCGPSRGVHECHIAPDPGQLAALDARPDRCGLVALRSAGERAAKPACPCYTISVECPGVDLNIKDLDDGVGQRLREQAAAAGMSVQQYLRNELTRIAARRSPAELVEGRQPMNRAEFAAVRQRLRDIDAA